jgi:hypothetical protein
MYEYYVSVCEVAMLDRFYFSLGCVLFLLVVGLVLLVSKNDGYLDSLKRNM